MIINPKGTPAYPWFLRPNSIVSGSRLFIAGPDYKDVLMSVDSTSVALPANGGISITVFDGSSFVPVASTLSWAVRQESFGGSLLRVRPSSPVNLLKGIPSFDFSLYPYARINATFTGTPSSGFMFFVTIPDSTVAFGRTTVGSITAANQMNRTGDPYEYYGNLQSGPPVVRGLYIANLVESHVYTGASQSFGGKAYVWIDGHIDSFDRTKIKWQSLVVLNVTAIAGFGGQLLAVDLPSSYFGSSPPDLVFEAGALNRAGQPSTAQNISMLTNASKRFVMIAGNKIVQTSADWFKLGESVSSTTLPQTTVPFPLSDRYISKLFGDDPLNSTYPTIFIELGPIPTPRITALPTSVTTYVESTFQWLYTVSPHKSVVASATPAVTGTQTIAFPKRAGSANDATRNGYRAIVPLTCSGHLFKSNGVNKDTRFKAPYATAQTAVTADGIIYNITRDQWASVVTTFGTVYAYDADVDLPAATAALQTYLQPVTTSLTGWQVGDACVAFGAELFGVSAARPSVRVSGGVYPLAKSPYNFQVTGNLYGGRYVYNEDTATSDFSPVFYSRPQPCPGPKSWDKIVTAVRFYSNQSGGGFISNTLQQVKDFYDALEHCAVCTLYFREYTGPFASQLPADDLVLNTSQFTAIATLPWSGSFCIDVQIYDPSTSISSYDPSYYYYPGDWISITITVPYKTGFILYRKLGVALNEGYLSAPDPNSSTADWSVTGPYFYSTYPVNVRVVVSGYSLNTYAGVHDHKVGHYAVVGQLPTETQYQAWPDYTQYSSTTYGPGMMPIEVYAYSKYPLHLNALKDEDSAYPGRIWTSEFVVPHLP